MSYNSWGEKNKKSESPSVPFKGWSTLRTGFAIINPTFPDCIVKRYFKMRIKLYRAEVIRSLEYFFIVNPRCVAKLLARVFKFQPCRLQSPYDGTYFDMCADLIRSFGFGT